MACLCSLVNQEYILLQNGASSSLSSISAQLLSLVFFKLYFVQILHLSELWLIDLIHYAACLESALQPKSVRIDCFLIDTVLALTCVN